LPQCGCHSQARAAQTQVIASKRITMSFARGFPVSPINYRNLWNLNMEIRCKTGIRKFSPPSLPFERLLQSANPHVKHAWFDDTLIVCADE
jgi:hypothetical protein